MVSVGSMRSKATFVKNTPINVMSGEEDSWSSFFVTYGNLRKRTGGRALEAGALQINTTHEFICRFATNIDNDINKHTKVLINGKVYTVDDWTEIEEKRFYYKFQLNASDETITLNGSTGGGGLIVETAATKAAVTASTEKRFVEVLADETQNGAYTLYFYNGTTLIPIMLA